MDLDTLDQRLRLLERELAAARWRTRAVCAAAVGLGLVFACRSSKGEETPPMKQLVIGGVTIDEHGIVIDGLGKGITIKHEKQKTSLSAGMVRVSDEHASGTLAASAGSGRLELQRGDNQALALATETWASIRVERTKATLGHHAELRIGDGKASVLAKHDERSASLWASPDEASAGVSDIKSTGRLEAKAGKTALVYQNP